VGQDESKSEEVDQAQIEIPSFREGDRASDIRHVVSCVIVNFATAELSGERSLEAINVVDLSASNSIIEALTTTHQARISPRVVFKRARTTMPWINALIDRVTRSSCDDRYYTCNQ
jgi:hypothetical protein